MQTRSRGAASLVGVAAVALIVSGCGGGSSGSGSSPGGGGSTAPSTTKFTKISINAGGTPAKGGTLNVLGTSDTDYLDANITYYSLGYAFIRPISRQLYSYPATSGHQTDVVPDIATGPPQVSSDGKTYTVSIKQGVKWNTSPPRQVTADDIVRGVKSACNPVQPFGGLPDFNFLIQGYTKFCTGFSKVQPNASAIAAYANGHPLPGVEAKDPSTVIFHLTQPAVYFASMLALPVFSPRPKEYDAYVPGSSQLAQHTISDGPYIVSAYTPTKSITYTRNTTSWDSSTDPLRKAYVDKIIVTMTNDPESAQKQLQTDTASADMFMGGIPSTDIPGLLAKNDPGINVESEIASNPYVLFNTQSPNNGGALKKVAVRQALSEALNRTHIIQVMAGPKISPPLTHVLPPEIEGGSPDFDLYPNDPTKAKSDLAAAGVKNMTLKFLYRPSSPTSTKIFQTVQADLKNVGITVKGVQSPDADFYTKYLERPDTARHGVWDLSLAGWGPDWYGNAALSFFAPLFDGRQLPPSSSNFGLFNDPTTNACIDKAKAATTEAASTAAWRECDHDVMKAAAFFPLSDPNEATYHPNHLHNAVYMPEFQCFDFTNVWMDSNKQGG